MSRIVGSKDMFKILASIARMIFECLTIGTAQVPIRMDAHCRQLGKAGYHMRTWSNCPPKMYLIVV